VTDRSFPADLKRTSVLRRVPLPKRIRVRSGRGNEGDVCVFELPADAIPLTVESPNGRVMAIAPGDVFLATPGHRESTRWVSGVVPGSGLIPGTDYWVLADCGVIGELVGEPRSEFGHFGRVRYLGTVCGSRGETLNVRQFAFSGAAKRGRQVPVYLVLGTSGDSGKTTAGIAVVRTLRAKGHATVIALKATGTSSIAEIATYEDFGAARALDCIDFGLPTTYPSGRAGIDAVFGAALDYCFSLPADALVVECGGDLFGANVPAFIACLKARRADLRVVLAAADALGALGATHTLAEAGLGISLITGPCTDTPALRQRTETLCRVPAINLLRGLRQRTPAHASSAGSAAAAAGG
jgi:hypothetical protein